MDSRTAKKKKKASDEALQQKLLCGLEKLAGGKKPAKLTMPELKAVARFEFQTTIKAMNKSLLIAKFDEVANSEHDYNGALAAEKARQKVNGKSAPSKKRKPAPERGAGKASKRRRRVRSGASSSSKSKISEHAEEQESKQNTESTEESESEEPQESSDASDGEGKWEFEVYFPKEKGWFKGRVLEEEPTENGTESWVVFEDGDKFWLFLGKEKVRPIELAN